MFLSRPLFAFLALTTSSFAADMTRVRAPQLNEDPLPGVYLRGDIGISRLSNPSATYNGVGGSQALDNEKTNSSFLGGFGIGYQKDWIRADLTFDYAAGSNYSDKTPCWQAGCGANTITNSGKVAYFTAMLNAYADLGTWNSLTPYIGAGLGLASATVSSFNGTTYAGAVPTTTLAPAQTKQNFAFALMAGTSYSINKSMMLDLGYRFVHLGNGGTSKNAAGDSYQLNGLKAHEVRLGLRYMLN